MNRHLPQVLGGLVLLGPPDDRAYVRISEIGGMERLLWDEVGWTRVLLSGGGVIELRQPLETTVAQIQEYLDQDENEFE